MNKLDESHSARNDDYSDESERQLQEERQRIIQQYQDGRQIIHSYLMEDDVPATILEVNSAEYTEQTESMSIVQNEGGSSTRLSPFNKEGYFYKYP